MGPSLSLTLVEYSCFSLSYNFQQSKRKKNKSGKIDKNKKKTTLPELWRGYNQICAAQNEGNTNCAYFPFTLLGHFL